MRAGEVYFGKVVLRLGVPQGSILGPLPFALYTSQLCRIISHANEYADDIQLYLTFWPINLDCSVVQINNDLNIIHYMAIDHALHSNAMKTVALLEAEAKALGMFS